MGRGPHTADKDLFGEDQHAGLREAVSDLSWLLGRGYVDPSALKLVGDRYRLRQRQRTAVRRSACPDGAVSARGGRRLELSMLADRPLAIDGFNVIIVVESALAGGVVLRGRDGVHRDIASVHGSYRRVEATARALELLVAALRTVRPSSVTWALDRPVSNSGRLRDLILEAAPDDSWRVELPHDADRHVLETGAVVATADANVLDRCGEWIDLPGAIIAASVPDAWVVDLEAPA